MARPFALVGLVGSCLVSGWLFDGSSAPLRWAVIAAVTLVSLLLGRIVFRPLAKGPVGGALFIVLVGLGGLVAGALAGVLGALVRPTELGTWNAMAGYGAVLGVFLSAGFLLPLALVTRAQRRLVEARPGSFLAKTQRHRVWVVTVAVAGYAAGAAACMLPNETAFGGRTRALTEAVGLTIGAAVVLVLFTLLDAVYLRRLHAVVEGLERIAEPHEPHAEPEVDVDLGIGDERWIGRSVRTSPYRALVEVTSSVRGSVFAVQRLLTRAVLTDAALVVASLLLLMGVVARGREGVPIREPAEATPYVEPVAASATAVRAGALSLYPYNRPILVDLNNDETEDIVSLRWDAGHEAAALSVTATDGKSLTTLWQTPALPTQWASSDVRLLRSGEVLFLSDSEGQLHIYGLRTGREVSGAIPLPPSVRLTCSAGDGEPRAWLWQASPAGAGFVVDEHGAMTPAAVEPKWCVRDDPRRCDGPPGDGACTTYHFGTGSVAPHFQESYALEDGSAGVGVAVGVKTSTPPDAVPVYTLAGYDPKTRKLRWQEPVARDDGAHASPGLHVDLAADRVFTFYQRKNGHWELGARNAHTGEVLWDTEPPRAVFGTSFDSLTVTGQRVYLALSNRLEVFSPRTGESLGVVW